MSKRRKYSIYFKWEAVESIRQPGDSCRHFHKRKTFGFTCRFVQTEIA